MKMVKDIRLMTSKSIKIYRLDPSYIVPALIIDLLKENHQILR